MLDGRKDSFCHEIADDEITIRRAEVSAESRPSLPKDLFAPVNRLSAPKGGLKERWCRRSKASSEATLNFSLVFISS
jgi:hypothetical protein